MKTIETTIKINAPISSVWKVLMDHEDYPNWNPFIKEITGNSSVDSSITVSIQMEKEKAMEFKPLILKNEEEKEFRWLGHLYVRGLFDGEHYFKLERESENETRFIHGEKFSGLMAGIIYTMIKEKTELGFNAMNQALKSEAEKNI
jgi:hypothetical protein